MWPFRNRQGLELRYGLRQGACREGFERTHDAPSFVLDVDCTTS
jgi:hypothetical protein